MPRKAPKIPQQKRRVLVPVEDWSAEAWAALAALAQRDDSRIRVIGPTDVVVRNP